MSDPGDGAGGDGPSDDPADDPFEYPSDAPADDGGRPDAARDGSPRFERPPASDPGPDAGSGADSPSGVVGWLKWFWTTDSGAVVYARDVFTSVAAVLVVGLLLFAVSGIWPPMVAVESNSMQPNMERGDLVFVVDNDRFVPEAAVEYWGETTGVVPAARAASIGYTEFGRPGDVIVFMPNGNDRRTPVIHRAMLFVEKGENWYDRAVALDPAAVGDAENCDALDHCPAPHAGFITQGDNNVTNSKYDQVSGLSAPVRPAWVIGTAEVKVPYLGYVRLAFSGQVAPPVDRVAATPGEPVPEGVSASGEQQQTGPTPTVPTAGTARPVA